MTTLIDRYVWATIRSLPQRQRTDVERELRASIGDAMESRIESGVHPADAERAVLTELGDPARLAANYADRPLHLIGPTLFLDYQRLLTTLVSIVPPVAMSGVVLGGLLNGTPIVEMIADTVSVGLTTLFHMAFWTTLLFAVLERSAKHERVMASWRTADLPALSASGREDIWATAFSVAGPVGLIAALHWQHHASPFRDASGAIIPVLDPALWTLWLPFFIAVLVAEAVFAIVLYRRGGWTLTFALVNVALNVLGIVPMLVLLRTGRLFNPDFLTQMPLAAHAHETGALTTVLTVALVGIALTDIAVGFVKTRRATAAGVGGVDGDS